jgi:hypothetical protein
MNRLTRAILLILGNLIFALLAFYVSVSSLLLYGLVFLTAFLLSNFLIKGKAKENLYFISLCVLSVLQPLVFYPNYFILIAPVVFTLIYFFLFTKYYYEKIDQFSVSVLVSFIALFYAVFFVTGTFTAERILNPITSSIGILKYSYDQSYFRDLSTIFFYFNFLLLTSSFLLLLFTKGRKTEINPE